MISIQILEPHDILLPTDWCRPLSLHTMSGGMSDSYSFESVYSGAPENNVKWAEARAVFGKPWFNKPLGTLIQMALKDHTPYEFARGPIPHEHCLKTKHSFA